MSSACRRRGGVRKKEKAGKNFVGSTWYGAQVKIHKREKGWRGSQVTRWEGRVDGGFRSEKKGRKDLKKQNGRNQKHLGRLHAHHRRRKREKKRLNQKRKVRKKR